MNTAELREHAEETMNFDAHEFDGLRDALEKEAEGLFGHVDQFVREHPLVCIGIAAAAGFAIAATIASQCRKSEQPS